MNYRQQLYSSYVSSHTFWLYGKVNLDEMKRQFPVYRRYYGSFLPDNKNVKILDIGCGNGGFVYFLQSIGYRNTSGVDISKEQVDLACKLGIENITWHDIKEFLLRQCETYDLIFARDTLEHFTKNEALQILENMYKSLKARGLVIIQVPNGENIFCGRIRYGDFTHETAFTRNSLHQILTVIGFRDIKFYPTGPVPHGMKSIARYILWKGIEAILKTYMLIETGTSLGIFTQNIIAVAKKRDESSIQ
jgi:2-polyprenyl-3-methyl-5-hydroxy-6-metoxy-1,4-benzoquinol methylase